MAQLTICCFQAAGSRGEPTANLAALEAAATTARREGADVLVTTELFVTGYAVADLAAIMSAALLDEARRIARDTDIALVVGIPALEDGNLLNTATFIAADGEVVARHVKSHLYLGMDQRFTPGSDPVTLVDYRGVTFGLLICYDIEFPEPARIAALSGAHALLIPTANFEPFAELNEHLIWTRAWENQIYVAYTNHTGSEGRTRYVGLSSVVSPTGEVLARGEKEDVLLYAVVDTAEVDQARTANTYLKDRRPGLYRALTLDGAASSSTEHEREHP